MEKKKGKDTPEKLPKEVKQESRTRTVIATVLSILFLLFAMAITVTVFTSRATGYPRLFGYSFLSVQSDSMEPTFKKGDLLISKSATAESALECKVDDIITFTMLEESSGATIINTHRIIEVEHTSNGYTYYITQGDKNKTINESVTERVASAYVLGTWTGHKLNGVGKVLDFLQSPMGFGLCVLLPIAIFFLYYLIDFIKKFSAYKAEVAAEEAAAAAEAAAKAAKEAELSDEEKRRIAEEYIKQMQEKASEKKEE